MRVPYMFKVGNAVERDVGVRTCTPAVPNSSGRPASIETWGRPIVSLRDLNLVARDLPRDTFGFFLTSRTPASVPMAGGGLGTLCLGGSIGRFSDQVLSSGIGGGFDLRFDPHDIPTPTGSVAGLPGETWYFQAWFRDADPTPTSNLTDAVALTLL